MTPQEALDYAVASPENMNEVIAEIKAASVPPDENGNYTIAVDPAIADAVLRAEEQGAADKASAIEFARMHADAMMYACLNPKGNAMVGLYPPHRPRGTPEKKRHGISTLPPTVRMALRGRGHRASD